MSTNSDEPSAAASAPPADGPALSVTDAHPPDAERSEEVQPVNAEASNSASEGEISTELCNADTRAPQSNQDSESDSNAVNNVEAGNRTFTMRQLLNQLNNGDANVNDGGRESGTPHSHRYATALERNPEDYDALYNWALVLQKSADNVSPESSSPSKYTLLEEACKKYEEAIRLCPTLNDAYYNWAIAISDRAKMRGRTKEAEDLWKQYDAVVWAQKVQNPEKNQSGSVVEDHHRRIPLLPVEPTAPLWPRERKTKSEGEIWSSIEWKSKYEKMELRALTLSSENEVLKSEIEALKIENDRLQPAAEELPGVREDGVRVTDILKCIIFSGLDESVNALRVLIPIFAIGEGKFNWLRFVLAFVAGGLLNITPKMIGMRRGSKTEYEKNFGRRRYFPLHFVIVSLSQVILGILPSIIFWFPPIRRSWNVRFLYAVVSSIAITISLKMIKEFLTKPPPRQYIWKSLYCVGLVVLTYIIAYNDGQTFSDDD